MRTKDDEIIEFEMPSFWKLNRDSDRKDCFFLKISNTYYADHRLMGLPPLCINLWLYLGAILSQSDSKVGSISVKTIALHTQIRPTSVRLLIARLEQNQIVKLKNMHSIVEIDSIVHLQYSSKVDDNFNQNNSTEVFDSMYKNKELIDDINTAFCNLFEVEKLDVPTKRLLPRVAAYYKTREDFEISVNNILETKAVEEIMQHKDRGSRLRRYVLTAIRKQLDGSL